MTTRLHVHCREGAGYSALSISFSRLRYSYGAETALTQALADAFGPVTFHSTTDIGPVTLLIYYFDTSRLEHPIEIDEVRRIAGVARDQLGGPGQQGAGVGLRRT